MVKFLEAVLSIKTMQEVSLSILTKKKKEKLRGFLDHAADTLQQDYPRQVAALIK